MGMGGFADVHHKAVRQMEAEGIARLVSVCDPCPENFPELMDDLLSRGVDVSRDYGEMLQRHADDLDDRLKHHNAGAVPSTKPHRPWRIKTVTAFTDEARARDFERYLKTQSGRAFTKKHL